MSRTNVKPAAVFSVMAMVALLGFAAASAASAQENGEYEELPVPPALLADTPKAKDFLKKREQLVNFILLGSKPFEDNKTEFDQWFRFYYFPLMTHESEFPGLVEKRQKFFKTLRSQLLPTPVHDYLVDTAYQVFEPVVKGNFHPVARYNAMLLIGELNAVEAKLTGTPKELPVPYIRAMGLALTEIENPQQIDAVRVAALVSILRHMKIERNSSPDKRRVIGNAAAEKRISEVLLVLVNQPEPPAGRNQEGHDWMRRRAIQILGQMGSVGANNTILNALQNVLADKKAAVSLRCDAAVALGSLQYPGNVQLDISKTLKELATLAAVACHKEIQRVEEQRLLDEKRKERIAASSPFGTSQPSYGSPAMGAFGAPTLAGAAAFDPRSYRVKMSRRRIYHDLMSVMNSLTGSDGNGGLVPLVKADADKKYAQTLADRIGDIVAVAEDFSFSDINTLLTGVRNNVQKLEQDCGVSAQVPNPDGSMPGDDLLSKPLTVPADGELDLSDSLDLPDDAPAEAEPKPADNVAPPAKNGPPAAKAPPADLLDDPLNP